MAEDRTGVPLVLKFEGWPEVDQAAWQALLRSGGFFSDEGACAHLSEGSRRLRLQGYGQWLSFVQRKMPEAMDDPPTSRITPEAVVAYITECRQRLAPQTVLTLLSSLYVIARALGPAQDWSWLERLSKRLMAAADGSSLKRRAPITAADVFSWSLRRMTEASDVVEATSLQRAIWFRQALMIGFLISRPVRRRTLLSMTVGTHVTGDARGYQVNFTPEDMKDGRRRTFPLPRDLTRPMSEYLAEHRPALLQGRRSAALWISQYGAPITADGLSRELPKVTQRHLGVALRPHRFRDIAATSIAEVDPEHVGIIRDILGHASLDMAQKHYNRARMAASCNALQSIVEDIRRDMPRIRRAKKQPPHD